ncbi:MAG: hypothetical protein ACXVHB_05960 [Solirubrobacteraceae bacterium]
MAAQPQEDKRSLLELAIDVHQDLGALATGLAHAGADPNAVKGLQRIVVMIGDIAKTLGAGPVGASPSQPGGPEQGEPAPGGPPAGGPEPAPGGPPAAAPAGPPQGARPGERPNAMHAATLGLQAALAHAKAAKQASGQ